MISRILEHGATVHGERSEVATWTGEDVRRMSYAEVGRHAAQLAHGLKDELGIAGDERIGTLCWNNNEHLISYLAVPSMGAVLHPLNLRLPPAQLAYVANHAEDKVIIVDNTLVPLLAAVLPQLTTVEHIVVVGPADTTALAGDKPVYQWDELLAGRPETYDWPVLDERDAASLCYTSGTTGHPKGVAYSHRSIYLHSMQGCMAESFKLSPADTTLAVVPMFHAGAWGLPYASLMSGGSLLMPDRFLQAAPLAAMIAAAKPTFAGAVPTIWTDLLRYLDEHPTDTSTLKEVVVGGSACPPSLMEAYQERHGINVVHAWGMTETSPLGSVSRPPAGVDTETTWRYRVTQGRVPASVEARIIGPDGQPAATDGETVGELEVRGPWVAARYIGDAEPDPDKFDDGWLRTGDVGLLSSDGFITLTDRAKDVIKSGGEWISSVDLENHLMAHPAVAEAAVIAVPDERWDERPLATVVLEAEGAAVSAADLRAFLADRVPKWQLPEHWSFLKEVPKTSVGKFDKKVLRARHAEGGLDVTTL
ncbi:MAG: long-chain fatty acid--CoA ligase [Micromonosporaceae bacterium]